MRIKFIHSLFVTDSSGSIAFAPLNGQRASDISPWQTFEGSTLTFFNWFPSTPANGATIMIAVAGQTQMGARPASVFYPGYICEIP